MAKVFDRTLCRDGQVFTVAIFSLALSFLLKWLGCVG